MATQINLPNQARMVWYADEITAEARREAMGKIRLACEFVKVQVQRNISVSARAAGPSEPGDYPHANIGRLRQSIFAEYDESDMSGIVGTTMLYGLWLEYGTAGGKIIRAAGKALTWIDKTTGQRVFAKQIRQGAIKERSFLRRTLVEEEASIRRILESKWGAGAGARLRVA